MQDYLLAIDWRRAKFFLGHPTVPPVTIERPLLMPQHACFLPCACIDNVIAIRDWLHDTVLLGGFRLLGQWMTSVFQGIVLCFDNALDLGRFRSHWSPLLLSV